MTGKTYSLITLFGLVLIAGLAVAGEPNPEARANESPTTVPYSSATALVGLEAEYGLWIDAKLRHKDDLVDRHERELLAMISYDILISQEDVRQLARRVALSTGSESDGEAADNPRAEFDHRISHLNTKESIYRSLCRARAFSNKYRLVGDYIGLLRREAERERIEMATVEPDQASAVKKD